MKGYGDAATWGPVRDKQDPRYMPPPAPDGAMEQLQEVLYRMRKIDDAYCDGEWQKFNDELRSLKDYLEESL